MDEIPAKVVNFNNDISNNEAIEDIEDFFCVKNNDILYNEAIEDTEDLFCVKNSEKKCPGINPPSTLLWPMKVERPARSKPVTCMDFILSKTHKLDLERSNSGEKDLFCYMTECCDIIDKAKQQLEKDRSFNKLERVCANRGLSVDRKCMDSDTAKDSFDMRNLIHALPSTSKPFSMYHKHRERIKQCLSSTDSERKNRSLSKRSLSKRLSLIEKFNFKAFTSREIELCGGSCFLNLDIKNFSDMSKTETTACKEETFQEGACHDQGINSQPNFCPEFAKMSLDDKPEVRTMERQNSDLENELPSFELPHQPKSLQDARWFVNSGIPKVHAPQNNPRRNVMLQMKNKMSTIRALKGARQNSFAKDKLRLDDLLKSCQVQGKNLRNFEDSIESAFLRQTLIIDDLLKSCKVELKNLRNCEDSIKRRGGGEVTDG